MKKLVAVAILLAAPAFAAPALAQPPADALPLSQIIATIEAEDGFGYVDEVEWDSDGYWEIEYRRADGARIDVDIDPVSGEIRSR